jgi:membrane-associated phospholipid phosphatase
MSKQQQRPLRVAPVFAVVGLLLGTTAASAQTNTDPGSDSDQPQGGLLLDIKDYYTAPLHWDLKDWAYFGGTVGLFFGARHYDEQVRTHFIKEGATPIGGSTKDLKDGIPTIAAVAGTWVMANFVDSTAGRREVGNMVEAGGFSVVTTYALKFAAGRERPNETSDPNKWRKSGSSFPSFHAAAAFAVGTVLAESGADEHRILRRFLGYGAIAGYTAFERLKHNAHWLSDDVAGAAVGAASAHFVLERDPARQSEKERSSAFTISPLPGGAMVSYNLTLK